MHKRIILPVRKRTNTCQWPFQDPKLEVPTIYKAYVRKYPQKIWPYMVQYLHFRILKFPLKVSMIQEVSFKHTKQCCPCKMAQTLLWNVVNTLDCHPTNLQEYMGFDVTLGWYHPWVLSWKFNYVDQITIESLGSWQLNLWRYLIFYLILSTSRIVPADIGCHKKSLWFQPIRKIWWSLLGPSA